MHKETRVTSREALLSGFEELPVTVNFSPSLVGCIDALLRIRLVGCSMRHSVSILLRFSKLLSNLLAICFVVLLYIFCGFVVFVFRIENSGCNLFGKRFVLLAMLCHSAAYAIKIQV